MNLDSIKKRIGEYLTSDKRWPVIVDFSSKEDLADFIEHFTVGDNKFLSAEKFCREDGTFKPEEFINTIGNNDGNTFVVGITAFLKLHGEIFTKNTLKSILSKSVNGHIVVVSYQCKNFLRFTDTRFSERNQIYVADGDLDAVSDICLISPALADAFPGSHSGFDKLGKAYEKQGQETIYIATDVSKSSFEQSLFNISQMNNSYDILCNKDSRTKTIPSNFGTLPQWNTALKMMSNGGDWTSIVEAQFGSIYGLADNVEQYN
jgi:hypothetical protein